MRTATSWARVVDEGDSSGVLAVAAIARATLHTCGRGIIIVDEVSIPFYVDPDAADRSDVDHLVTRHEAVINGHPDPGPIPAWATALGDRFAVASRATKGLP